MAFQAQEKATTFEAQAGDLQKNNEQLEGRLACRCAPWLPIEWWLQIVYHSVMLGSAVLYSMYPLFISLYVELLHALYPVCTLCSRLRLGLRMLRDGASDYSQTMINLKV